MHFVAEYIGNRFFSFHRPDVPLKGAALLCSPLFHEYYKAHAWLRQTALDLAAEGWFVTRFDFSGHGDSPVVPDKVAVNGRIDDVRAAATDDHRFKLFLKSLAEFSNGYSGNFFDHDRVTV